MRCMSTVTVQSRDERSNHGVLVLLMWTTVYTGKRFPHKSKIYTQDLTSKEEENQDHDKCVAKVQKGRGCSSDCQFSDKEMNRVQEEIHCSTTTSQEWTPPPVIILQTKRTLRLSSNQSYWSKKKEFATRIQHLLIKTSCTIAVAEFPHVSTWTVFLHTMWVKMCSPWNSLLQFSILHLAAAEWLQNFAFRIFR